MKEDTVLTTPRSNVNANGNANAGESRNANGAEAAEDLFKRQLLATLTALKVGDFSARMPGDLTGLDGKIADAFNEVVGRVERFGNGLFRLRNEVGRKGKFNER